MVNLKHVIGLVFFFAIASLADNARAQYCKNLGTMFVNDTNYMFRSSESAKSFKKQACSEFAVSERTEEALRKFAAGNGLLYIGPEFEGAIDKWCNPSDVSDWTKKEMGDYLQVLNASLATDIKGCNNPVASNLYVKTIDAFRSNKDSLIDFYIEVSGDISELQITSSRGLTNCEMSKTFVGKINPASKRKRVVSCERKKTNDNSLHPLARLHLESDTGLSTNILLPRVELLGFKSEFRYKWVKKLSNFNIQVRLGYCSIRDHVSIKQCNKDSYQHVVDAAKSGSGRLMSWGIGTKHWVGKNGFVTEEGKFISVSGNVKGCPKIPTMDDANADRYMCERDKRYYPK